MKQLILMEFWARRLILLLYCYFLLEQYDSIKSQGVSTSTHNSRNKVGRFSVIQTDLHVQKEILVQSYCDKR